MLTEEEFLWFLEVNCEKSDDSSSWCKEETSLSFDVVLVVHCEEEEELLEGEIKKKKQRENDKSEETMMRITFRIDILKYIFFFFKFSSWWKHWSVVNSKIEFFSFSSHLHWLLSYKEIQQSNMWWYWWKGKTHTFDFLK